MEMYQERVIQEKKELDEKIVRLQNFMYSDKAEDLPHGEEWRILAQLHHMINYSAVLGARISAWGLTTSAKEV